MSISHSGPIWIQPATFQVVWRHRYLVATMLDRVFLTQKMIADLRPDVACFRALSLGLWSEHSSFSAGQSEPRTPGTLDPRQWTEGSFFMQRCSWEPSVLLLLTLPSSSSLSLLLLLHLLPPSCFYMEIPLLPKDITDRTLFNTPKSVVSWLIESHSVS